MNYIGSQQIIPKKQIKGHKQFLLSYIIINYYIFTLSICQYRTSNFGSIAQKSQITKNFLYIFELTFLLDVINEIEIYRYFFNKNTAFVFLFFRKTQRLLSYIQSHRIMYILVYIISPQKLSPPIPCQLFQNQFSFLKLTKIRYLLASV